MINKEERERLQATLLMGFKFGFKQSFSYTLGGKEEVGGSLEYYYDFKL